ncbi:hypothetical protein [Actinoalloteichus hymeniacidonis]|uniref:Uncharacterized protein n=1 Tax=Actinoalloteichus hymeniacidonis TaxID=340345 RepID=A0AAC9HKX1_9PSEU|nr:hypothetical protein [Actinoalloteichus hymeniacidonis]AOS61208.1 hypothetical protein TL08_01845 [Actinoalloteichus hymeniacidonis]MBB5910790.1 hypothetical protein [Actinoalloteichus hymeniacidonis]
MSIDGFVGTALGGLALMVFGVVLIWISFGEPVAVLASHSPRATRTASDHRYSPQATHTTARATAPRRIAASPRDEALLTIGWPDAATSTSSEWETEPDPFPLDDFAFEPARFDPTAGDVLLLRETLDADPAEDDFYCVAAIAARCWQTPSQSQEPQGSHQSPLHRHPTPSPGYVTAFTGSLDVPLRSAA